jgi:hypothetical protein
MMRYSNTNKKINNNNLPNDNPFLYEIIPATNSNIELKSKIESAFEENFDKNVKNNNNNDNEFNLDFTYYNLNKILDNLMNILNDKNLKELSNLIEYPEISKLANLFYNEIEIFLSVHKKF